MKVSVLCFFLALLGCSVEIVGQTCTLRVGARHGGDGTFIGWNHRPTGEELLTGIKAVAIHKDSKKTYQSYEIDGLRYFEKLPEGPYRIVLSKPGYRTSYERHYQYCGDDPYDVTTSFYKLVPGNSKLITNNDPKIVKEMRLDRITKLGSAYEPVITGGELLNLIEPRISPRAKNVSFVGDVRIMVNIDRAGKVVRAEAASGHPQLLADCEMAALYSTYSPKLINGQPTLNFEIITYSFPLSNSANSPNEKPRTLSGGVLNGKAISLPKPAYPPAARAVKASGSVSVQVLISESGYVVSANAVSGHPLLRAAAEEAALGARFAPTLLEGNPVKVSGVITYNFVP